MNNERLLEELSRRIDDSAKETRDYVDRKVDASAKETRDYVDRKVDASAKETRDHVDASAKETRSYVDASARETKEHLSRQFAEAVADLRNGYETVAAGLEQRIRVIAEGHVTLAQKIDSLPAYIDVKLEELEGRVTTAIIARDEKLARDLRAEIRGELAEVRRLGRLETTMGELAARVERLEQKIA